MSTEWQADGLARMDDIDSLLANEKGPLEEKIDTIWQSLAPGKTCITRAELAAVLEETCTAGGTPHGREVVKRLTANFFLKAGKGNSNRMIKEDFTHMLKRKSELVQSFQAYDDLLLEDEGMQSPTNMLSECFAWPTKASAALLRIFRVDDLCFFAWVAVLFLGEVAGFVVAFAQNDSGPIFAIEGWTRSVAKGSAKAIQVVVAVLPFTMARSFLTVLRAAPLRKWLPINKQLDLHKALGFHLLLWSSMHTICHLVNIARFSDETRHQAPQIPVMSQAELYSEEVSITGLLLVFCLVLGLLCAASWPYKEQLMKTCGLNRLQRSHEVFYTTHILFSLALLVLLVIHPLPKKPSNWHSRGTTWIYLAPGTLICVAERLARSLKRLLFETPVVGVVLHQGGVTELHIKKPRQFRRGFRQASGDAGQFCFLNIPELSKYEWHPFSITSGPEDSYLSFHIQSVGNWTRSLHSLCQEKVWAAQRSPVEGPKALQEVSLEEGLNVDELQALTELKVNLDGPFGAPAQDHSSFSCLLLVGAGVGATPFLSVLKQLMSEYKASLCDCCKTANKRLFKPRKVYFYWLTRDQTAPCYFKTTLQEIKNGDVSDFLTIRICLTKGLPRTDPRLALTNVANSLSHDVDSFDALTGNYQPSPCLFGRPNWPATLNKISWENPGSKVGVFVCGPPGLSKQLHSLCIKANQEEAAANSRTKFDFHTELF